MPKQSRKKPVNGQKRMNYHSTKAGASKTTPGIKKKRRWKKGTVALREIREQQKSTKILFAKEPFQRLVREIANEVSIEPLRWQKDALEILREMAQSELLMTFKAANISAIHAKRKTIMKKDMEHIKEIKEIFPQLNANNGCTFGFPFHKRPTTSIKKKVSSNPVKKKITVEKDESEEHNSPDNSMEEDKEESSSSSVSSTDASDDESDDKAEEKIIKNGVTNSLYKLLTVQ
jgi:histone H3